MKHKPKITILLLVMFIITQFIGLAVINVYSPQTNQVRNETTGEVENITEKPGIPFGMDPPQEVKENTGASIASIIISLIIAVSLILILMRFKAKIILKLWFFLVATIAISITFNSALIQFDLIHSSIIALAIALPLTYLKIFKRDFIVHNLTELLIYPGIAVIFIPLLNIHAIIILLLLISVYDIYAVWHSGFMQKMAKYQINEVKIFNGFFVPYTDKETKDKIKKLKKKYKNDKEKLKDKKIKMNIGILGGGDIAFPLIFTGVVFQTIGIIAAISVIGFSSIALTYLLFYGKKGEFYPAMPFITAGCLTGLFFGYLLSII